MASATRECSWEQTYTGTCSVGSTRRVNEVEFIVRDLFTCPSVRVRDVRAAVVFAIDIEDEIESEKYYLHLVVRGLPWGGRNDDALDVSSDRHQRTFSNFYLSAFGAPLRSAYMRLQSLYASPVVGSGVSLLLFTRDKGGTVIRQVVQSAGDVAGYRPGQYICQGVMGASLRQSSSMPAVFDVDEDDVVNSRVVKSRRSNDFWKKKRGWVSSDDEERERSIWHGKRRCDSFSEYLSGYRYN